MHFRGASYLHNRLPRAYHSGDTGDLNHFLECLDLRDPATKKAVVGATHSCLAQRLFRNKKPTLRWVFYFY